MYCIKYLQTMYLSKTYILPQSPVENLRTMLIVGNNLDISACIRTSPIRRNHHPVVDCRAVLNRLKWVLWRLIYSLPHSWNRGQTWWPPFSVQPKFINSNARREAGVPFFLISRCDIWFRFRQPAFQIPAINFASGLRQKIVPCHLQNISVIGLVGH